LRKRSFDHHDQWARQHKGFFIAEFRLPNLFQWQWAYAKGQVAPGDTNVGSRPYSPDRNPDELVWKHLKADTVGRMAITDKAEFQSKVRASMRQLQNDPEKIRSFYQKPSLKYAA